MTEIEFAIATINDRIKNLNDENENNLIAEEETLLTAKKELNPFEFLEYKASIEVGRKTRQHQIDELIKTKDNLIFEKENYLEELKTKTSGAYDLRLKKAYERYQEWQRFMDREANKFGFEKGYTYSYTVSSIPLEEDKYYNDDWEFYKNDLKHPNSPAESWNPECRWYRITHIEYFKKHIINGEVPTTTLYSLYSKWFGEMRTTDIPIKSAAGFSKFRNDFFTSLHWDVLEKIYPSVSQYLGNESSYPNFVDFMENVPWPTPEQYDEAVKKYLGWGTKEFYENNVKIFETFAEINSKYKEDSHFHLRFPSRGIYGTTTPTTDVTYNPIENPLFEFHYGLPKKNNSYDEVVKYQNMMVNKYSGKDKLPVPTYEQAKEYKKYSDDVSAGKSPDLPTFVDPVNPYKLSSDNSNTFPSSAHKFIANDNAHMWYWPRPKAGHVFIPNFGFISPAFYTGAYTGRWSTPYYREKEARRRAEAYQQAMKHVANFQEYMKRAMDIYEFAMTWTAGLSFAALTGGTAAGAVGAVSSALSTTELGDSDLGSALLRVGEVIGVAAITDQALGEVLEQAIEKEMLGLAKKEFGEATGLDKTTLGRLSVDMAAGTLYGMYKDSNFVDALKGSADKAWRLEAARSNPYAALIIAGVTEMEKNGVQSTLKGLTDPEKWFTGFDWSRLGPELKSLAGSIHSKDVMKMVGLAFMVNQGYVSGDDAALYVGQEVAVRQIDRFYEDEPLYGPPDPKEQQFKEALKEKDRYKKGLIAVQKIKNKEPLSKDDIIGITEGIAEPIYNSIHNIFPKKLQPTVWAETLKIGLPNAVGWIPSVDMSLPSWVKDDMKKDDGTIPVVSKEQAEAHLKKQIEEDVEITKEEIIDLIVQLILPKDRPLVPVTGEGNAVPNYNIIDFDSNLHIIGALKFPFDHPMLKYGQVKRNYTREQINYMAKRDQQIMALESKIKEQEQYLKELGVDAAQMG